MFKLDHAVDELVKAWSNLDDVDRAVRIEQILDAGMSRRALARTLGCCRNLAPPAPSRPWTMRTVCSLPRRMRANYPKIGRPRECHLTESLHAAARKTCWTTREVLMTARSRVPGMTSGSTAGSIMHFRIRKSATRHTDWQRANSKNMPGYPRSHENLKAPPSNAPQESRRRDPGSGVML